MFPDISDLMGVSFMRARAAAVLFGVLVVTGAGLDVRGAAAAERPGLGPVTGPSMPVCCAREPEPDSWDRAGALISLS
jgi:hypothetical protein